MCRLHIAAVGAINRTRHDERRNDAVARGAKQENLPMPFDNVPNADLAKLAGFTPANHSSVQLYGAELRPVFDEQGEPVPGYQRLVNTDENKTIEVVGKSYTFVDNKVVFAEFERAIEQSGLDNTGLMVATDFGGPNLTRCFRQYVWPNHTIEVKPGVLLALRLVMFNSYDRSMSFSGRAGHYTFVCSNTAVVGSDVGRFALRHTGDLDIRSAIAGLVEAAELHTKQQERLREWPKLDLDDQQALGLLNALPKASKAQIDHLVHQYQRAKLDTGPQGGANLWTLFSTLTAWAAHGEKANGAMAGEGAGKGAVSAAIRSAREEQIAKLIDCEEWQEIEGWAPEAEAVAA
jgi:hypothetical protein